MNLWGRLPSFLNESVTRIVENGVTTPESGLYSVKYIKIVTRI